MDQDYQQTTWFMLVCIMVQFLSVTPSLAAEATARVVRGEVVAVNVKADPNVIVVSVILPNKEELIVGATVPPGTEVTRKAKAVPLADVKSGEHVILSYLKDSTGLVARSVHVH